MKRCDYCGKDEPDSSLACDGCGTPFPVADPAQSGSGGGPPRSPLGLSVVTASGVLLVSGALFFALGRAVVEMGLVPVKLPAGYPNIYAFVTSMRPAPLVVLVAIVPVFWLCQARCHGRSRAFVTAGLIILAMGMLALLPRIVPSAAILWCMPGFMLTGGGGASRGCYVGAAVQSAAGVWLLVWSHPRKDTNEELSA